MSNCKDESNLDYAAIHTGYYNRGVIGICGINMLWIGVIPELNKANINSLYAGSLVLRYLLEQNNNNLIKALKHYKGSKKNLEPVRDVIKTYKKIKKGLK